MQWNSSEFKLLALNEIEIKILENLNIDRNPTELAGLTKEPRTSINYNLKKLIKRGLVSKIKDGKRYRYVLNHKENIRDNFFDSLNHLGIESKGFHTKTKYGDQVIVYVGADEIIPAFNRIAFNNRNERVKAIQHYKSFAGQILLAKDEITAFNKAIIDNKIIIDGMLNESAYESYYQKIKNDPINFKKQVESLGGRMADYHVFPNDRFNYYSEIWIFETTTMLINWHNKIAVEIKNEDITFFLKDMFEYVKESSRKIDHNKAMSEMLEKL
jgi:sugar-specific transcriptional regulator TrmB